MFCLSSVFHAACKHSSNYFLSQLFVQDETFDAVDGVISILYMENSEYSQLLLKA